MQQPPNLAATHQNPQYPPSLPKPQYPPHQHVFHSQHLPPPPSARHPIPGHSRPPRQPVVQFVPNGLSPSVQGHHPINEQNGQPNDGQMAGHSSQPNWQHQQILTRESAAYLPSNSLYPGQNQFHQNVEAFPFVSPNGPIMECSETAGPPAAAAIPYAYQHFGGHHPPIPSGPPPHSTTAFGPILPPIPLPMPPPINMNNSHITPAAMAAAHAHPPPPHPHPHHHPHLPIPPPTMSGQHHHLMVNNKRTGPSPASGPTNTAENNIGISGPVDCWSTAVTGWEQAAIIKNKIGLVINGRFRIVQSIASGSYGEIFAAEDLHSHGPKRQRVAVKFDGACRDNHLRYEYEVYKSVLYEDGNGKVEGFPKVYSWSHEYGHNIMVMELLGAPVASLFAFCDRKFARQTIVSLGEQMIQRIRHLHQRGFIHRDIKPENFLMGLAGKESTLYLIDFGLARRYRFREGENRTLTHIPYRRGRSFIGTAKYASLNSHKNIELSRRDDLESLSYVLIELVNGHLPWKNISKRNATTRHQASQRIRQLKEQTNWDDFCPCLARFIRYCREIHFTDEPDYDKLLDLLQLIAVPPELSNSSAIPIRNSLRVKKISAAFCCQTLETAEKMTQVNLEQKINNEEKENGEREEMMGNERGMNIDKNDGETTKQLAHSIQRQLSLNMPENVSDFDEIGAATTTTSCSENELESGGAEKAITTRSGTGTADDEDSQPTPQQEQQQVCRKCRRLRDQNHQQQKRVNKEQQQQHLQQNQQHVAQRGVKQHGQPRLVDTGLQTDIQQQQQMHLPLASMQQKGQAEQKKMCWQRARESNAERRFQYENKFSWTLPLQAEPATLVTSHHHPGHIIAQPIPSAGHSAVLPSSGAFLTAPLPMPTPVHPLSGPIPNGLVVQPQTQDHYPSQFGMPPLVHPTVMHASSFQNGKQYQKGGNIQPQSAIDQFYAANLDTPPSNGFSTSTMNASTTSTAGVQQPILLTSVPPPPILPEAIRQKGGSRTLQVAFVLPPPPSANQAAMQQYN